MRNAAAPPQRGHPAPLLHLGLSTAHHFEAHNSRVLPPRPSTRTRAHNPPQAEQEAAKAVSLVSFHSTSKGFIGECGIRGGCESATPACDAASGSGGWAWPSRVHQPTQRHSALRHPCAWGQGATPLNSTALRVCDCVRRGRDSSRLRRLRARQPHPAGEGAALQARLADAVCQHARPDHHGPHGEPAAQGRRVLRRVRGAERRHPRLPQAPRAPGGRNIRGHLPAAREAFHSATRHNLAAPSDKQKAFTPCPALVSANERARPSLLVSKPTQVPTSSPPS